MPEVLPRRPDIVLPTLLFNSQTPVPPDELVSVTVKA
jgi:hypothetical protein